MFAPPTTNAPTLSSTLSFVKNKLVDPSVIWSLVPGIANCPVPLVYPAAPVVKLKLPLAISLMLSLFAEIVTTLAPASCVKSTPVPPVTCLI